MTTMRQLIDLCSEPVAEHEEYSFDVETEYRAPISRPAYSQTLLNEKKKSKRERFLKHAKKDFQKRYGDAWEKVLYATANKHFKEGSLQYYIALNEEKTTFYHGSKKEFPVGFVLKPQSDGYVHGVYGDSGDKQIRMTEKIMEKYRPKHMISRLQAVFLVDSKTTIEHAGGNTNFVYKVNPIGACEKSCLWWYSLIEREMENLCLGGKKTLTPKQLEEYALNYWNGVASPVSKGVWEYRCREASITKVY